MRTIAQTICFAIVLTGTHGASAGEVTISERNGSIILESATASADEAQAASAPAAMPAASSSAQSQPAQSPSQSTQAVPPATRVPVKAYYDKVDQANIEKRIADRAARTKKRSLEAEKDVAERAAKAQANQPVQQGQGAQTGQ